MFDFESQLRSADPARESDSSMPDFLAIARRVELREHTPANSGQIGNRFKILAAALSIAVVLIATVATLVSPSGTSNRPARRAYWNLPTSGFSTGPKSGYVSGNNFQFRASPTLSKSRTAGSLFEVKTNAKPFFELSRIAHAFGISTSNGVTSTSQPKQIELTAGDSSTATGSLTYLSYQGINPASYIFSTFHFAASDADKLIFTDQIANQPSFAEQRTLLSSAQTTWSLLQSSVALDGLHAKWQIVDAMSSTASAQVIIRLSVPLLVQGYGFGESANFEFSSNGNLLSADGPDVAIAKTTPVNFVSPTAGVSNLNFGLNSPCGSINSVPTAGSQLISSASSTTTQPALKIVDISNSQVMYLAQRTTNKSVWLIPFFQYSGQIGSLNISGFLGTSAMSSKQLSIVKSSNGTCVAKLVLR